MCAIQNAVCNGLAAVELNKRVFGREGFCWNVKSDVGFEGRDAGFLGLCK